MYSELQDSVSEIHFSYVSALNTYIVFDTILTWDSRFSVFDSKSSNRSPRSITFSTLSNIIRFTSSTWLWIWDTLSPCPALKTHYVQTDNMDIRQHRYGTTHTVAISSNSPTHTEHPWAVHSITSQPGWNPTPSIIKVNVTLQLTVNEQVHLHAKPLIRLMARY